MKTRLNYKHLRYFFEVARTGGVQAAADRLHVSAQAVSAQIRALEDQAGIALFDRQGRALVLTPAGRVAQQYAERIFTLGDELSTALSDHPGELTMPLKVGVTDSIPKILAARLLLPLIQESPDRELVVHEGPLDDLLERLTVGKLRCILTDREPAALPAVSLESERVLRSPMQFVCTPAVRDQLTGAFPACLHRAPMVLWESSSNLTSGLYAWFRRQRVSPRIVARCVDSAFLKQLAAADLGVAPVPQHIVEEAAAQLDLHALGDPIDVEVAVWMVQLGKQGGSRISVPQLPAG